MEQKSLSQWKTELKAELKSELEVRLKAVEQSLASLQGDFTRLKNLPKANEPWPWTGSFGGKRAKCGKCGQHILVKDQPGHEQICKGE